MSGLAAWVAYYQMKKQNYEVDLIAGTGLLGLVPRPADPWAGSTFHIQTCKINTDVLSAYGVFACGENSRCLSILGAAQIDRHGNINNTKTEKTYLIGAGGSNDAANAREVVVVMNQSSSRLVEKVPYITCPGEKVATLITDRGVFEKLGEGELILTGYFQTSS